MRLTRLGIMSGAAAMAAAAMLGPQVTAAQPPAPSVGRQRKRVRSTGYGGGRSRTTLQKTTGERECARRLRQIAAGSLRAENGLVS